MVSILYPVNITIPDTEACDFSALQRHLTAASVDVTSNPSGDSSTFNPGVFKSLTEVLSYQIPESYWHPPFCDHCSAKEPRFLCVCSFPAHSPPLQVIVSTQIFLLHYYLLTFFFFWQTTWVLNVWHELFVELTFFKCLRSTGIVEQCSTFTYDNVCSAADIYSVAFE